MFEIKRQIKIFILIALLCGALFAAYKMYDMASQYKAGKSTYSQLQAEALSRAESPAPETESPADKAAEETAAEEIPETTAAGAAYDFPDIDFGLLTERNGDTVGWVYIEGTNISYPVVQGEDNRHYVSTLFDGSPNQAGSIFMDYRNSPEMSDVHTILYGHNMRDKSMFADILNYQSQEYYEEHPVGLYMTAEGNYSFEIVAAYVASLADSAWQLEFVTGEVAHGWLLEAMEKSSFESRTVPEAGDKYITLSTCSYEFEDARFVLVGVLKAAG